MRRIIIVCLLFAIAGNRVGAQKLMRSMSPRTMTHLFNAKDIAPEAVEMLARLYATSHWAVLKKDSDPDDGRMELIVAKNMRLEWDELVEDSTPHNGLAFRFSRNDGMKLDGIHVVFSDEDEQLLFVGELMSLGFTTDDDETYSRQYTFPDGNQVAVNISVGWQRGLYVADVSLSVLE